MTLSSSDLSITQVAGATASLAFEGTGFYLYGGTLVDHGVFKIQVDDQPLVTLNGSTKSFYPRALLVGFSLFTIERRAYILRDCRYSIMPMVWEAGHTILK